MISDDQIAKPNPDHNQHQIPLHRFPSLYILTNTPKGRGVFTSTPIPPGTILEVSPVLVFDAGENATHIAHTQLQHYTYNWPVAAATGSSALTTSPDANPPRPRKPRTTTTTTQQALVLGLGSMFNHRGGGAQNVGWRRDVERGVVTYFALRAIAAGEELCISYGDRLTFVDADGPEREEEVAEEVLGRIEVGGVFG